MTDTRAGFWLQLAVVGLTLAIAGIILGFGTDADQSLEHMLKATIQPSANLLPVIGILLVSSEWSQRTAQVTFTLVPKRMRVMASKVLASLSVAVFAYAVSIVVALVAAVAVGGDMSLSATLVGQIAVLFAIAMVGGVAFGALFLASAPAIVAYLLAPIAWAAFLSIPAFDGIAPWLDGSRSYAPITDGTMSATEWAHVGTTTLMWVALPLAIGLWRISRNEVP
jgi:ABC-type transport system involved in multi-copper enzyme maturation permease subunit